MNLLKLTNHTHLATEHSGVWGMAPSVNIRSLMEAMICAICVICCAALLILDLSMWAEFTGCYLVPIVEYVRSIEPNDVHHKARWASQRAVSVAKVALFKPGSITMVTHAENITRSAPGRVPSFGLNSAINSISPPVNSIPGDISLWDADSGSRNASEDPTLQSRTLMYSTYSNAV